MQQSGTLMVQTQSKKGSSTRWRMTVLAALTFTLSTLAYAAPGIHLRTPAADPLLVQTTSGPVLGMADASSTYTWQGIPFAAPPVGANRWKAPVPPTPWTSTRTTTTLPSPCSQLDSDAPDGVLGSEDCLYLNVWKPQATSTSPRPVMVFIHGGGNTSGSTDFGMYYGDAFAAQANVVLVTIQYRLASLGFLNHEALQGSDPLSSSGNFGNLDQIRALEWVRDNAAAFGGDASRVTVFGESAGGINIWGLMLSGKAQGLFQRAIVESGCPYTKTLDDARQISRTLTEGLVVADGLADPGTAGSFVDSMTPEEVRTYLYGKSAAELLITAEDAGLTSETTYYSIEDGSFQRADALGRFERGDYSSVPMIVGANRDEMKIFFAQLYGLKKASYDSAMDTLYGDMTPEIESYYPLADYSGYRRYFNRFTDISDWWLQELCGTYAATVAAKHQNVWLYQFRYDDLENPYDELLGACHAAELPFIFQNYQDLFYPTDTLVNRDAVSNTMIGLWGCMGYTGNPTACAGLPGWGKLELTGANALQQIAFDDAGVRMEPIPLDEQEKIAFWEATYGIRGVEATPLRTEAARVLRLDTSPLFVK